jgi:hypothetical protein
MGKVFLTDPVNSTLRMHECGQNEYWFYHKGSYPNDNPLLYQQLIDNATSEIIIWDPYFNVKSPNRDQYVFANIHNNITIKILTLKGLDGPQTYLTEVQNALRMAITPIKNSRFGLRVINRGNPVTQAERYFHDRFLIIDDSDVYLIGSSLGYHIKSEQSTGIFKVSNNDTKDFIKSIFKHYWDNSTQNQIPLTYLHL